MGTTLGRLLDGRARRPAAAAARVTRPGSEARRTLRLDVRRLGGMDPRAHGPGPAGPGAATSGSSRGVDGRRWRRSPSDLLAPLDDFAQQVGLALVAAQRAARPPRWRCSRTATGSPATCTTTSSSGCSPRGCRCSRRRGWPQHPTSGPDRRRGRRARRRHQGHPAHDLRAAPPAPDRRAALRGRVPGGLLRRDARVRPELVIEGRLNGPVARARGRPHRRRA